MGGREVNGGLWVLGGVCFGENMGSCQNASNLSTATSPAALLLKECFLWNLYGNFTLRMNHVDMCSHYKPACIVHLGCFVYLCIWVSDRHSVPPARGNYASSSYSVLHLSCFKWDSDRDKHTAELVTDFEYSMCGMPSAETERKQKNRQVCVPLSRVCFSCFTL